MVQKQSNSECGIRHGTTQAVAQRKFFISERTILYALVKACVDGPSQAARYSWACRVRDDCQRYKMLSWLELVNRFEFDITKMKTSLCAGRTPSEKVHVSNVNRRVWVIVYIFTERPDRVIRVYSHAVTRFLETWVRVYVCAKEVLVTYLFRLWQAKSLEAGEPLGIYAYVVPTKLECRVCGMFVVLCSSLPSFCPERLNCMAHLLISSQTNLCLVQKVMAPCGATLRYHPPPNWCHSCLSFHWETSSAWGTQSRLCPHHQRICRKSRSLLWPCLWHL